MSDGRVRMDRDDESGIARLTLDNPERRNAYDPAMREQLGVFLDELAYDDGIKVVLLRGEGGVFSTGADMNNAYSWYGEGTNGKAGQRDGNTDRAGRPPAEPAAPAPHRSQDVRLLPFLPRLSRRRRWPRSPASRSGAASSSP